MTITPIQTAGPTTGTTPFTLTLTSVTSGSTLFVYIFYPVSGIRTFSVADNVNGSWTPGTLVIDTTSNRRCQGFYFIASASGTLTVTITALSGGTPTATATVTAVAEEFSACTFSSESTFTTGTASTTHYCAASGSLDVSGDSLIISGAVLHANAGTVTKTTGFTQLANTSDYLCQYNTSGSGFTDERSQFASTTLRREAGFSFGFIASGSSQSINVGIVTETESALIASILNPKSYSVAITTETESALSVTVNNPRSYTVGIATETESVLQVSVTNPRSYSVSIATEIESALSVSLLNPRSYVVGIVTEIETALSVSTGNSQQISVNTVTETETALTVSVLNPRSYLIGIVAETETALSCSIINPRSHTVGIVTETESALSVVVSTGALHFPYYYYET